MSHTLLHSFSRHLVPVYLEIAWSNHAPQPLVITCFAVSIRGHWLLVTAGHCLDEIAQAMTKGGTIVKSRLLDATTNESPYLDPIPFDYEASLPSIPLKNSEKNDYGLMLLTENHKELLQANGIEALDERSWAIDNDPPDRYFMVGIAGSGRTELSTERVRLSSVAMLVKERPECPDPSFLPHVELRWYAEVVTPERLPDLRGMSGGPILAVKDLEPGRSRYWLHAIQSAQSARYPAQPFIAANLAQPLARFVAEVIDGKHQDLFDSTDATR